MTQIEIDRRCGHWVEVSRAITADGKPSDDTNRMEEACSEYSASVG